MYKFFSQKISFPIIAILLTVIFSCCIFMFFSIDSRLLLSIESFIIDKKENITIGKQSDISFNQIPQDYMSVSYDASNNSFSWEVRSEVDSLCYYKINNYNPNRHTIKENSTITIKIGKGHIITLTGKELFACIDKFKSQCEGLFNEFKTQNILLRNLVRSIKGKEFHYIIKEKRIQSFIYINDDEYSLIILDKITSIDGNHYRYKGNTLSDSIPEPASCKIQFFSISDYSYMQKEVDKNGYYIDNINYAMKASVVTTEWGAGHVMLKPDKENKKIEVKFPKSIIYTDRLSKLKESSAQTAGLLSFKQMSNAFPATNTFYLPLFSKEVGYDICQFRFHDGELHINDGNNHLDTISSSFFFYPSMERFELNSGSNTILCRAGYIDSSYLLSYFILPLFLFITIFILSNYIFRTKDNKYSIYYKFLTSTAFIYCICKIFIAIKLSYSYPYFEKISGIIVTDTSLMLVMFLLLSLIINHDLLTGSTGRSYLYQKKAKGNTRNAWTAHLICMVLFACCLVTLYLMDEGINKEMLASYLHSELYPSSISQFQQSAAINDTHRSIWITLSFTILLGLLILSFLNIFSTLPFKKLSDFLHFRCKSDSRWKYTFQYIFFYVIIPCIFIGVCGFIPGNFATSFISFICILGLSRALTSIDILKLRPVWSGTLMVIVIPLCFIGIAMIPDHGYLTNYFGFVATSVCFYLIIHKYTTTNGFIESERKENKKEKAFINGIVIIVAASILLLPSVLSLTFNPEEISYSRLDRRAMLFSQYEKLKESGYRYAESDTEFMSVMSHYMYKTSTDDPLCNDEHILHSSISTGQSPVVLNDVSIQAAFFGAYGWKSYIVYFGLLLALSYMVLSMSLHNRSYLDTHTQWRLLAMFMWLSCSFYIFMSYIDYFPFTGRLNPGFGVDSVGEALESVLLLGFMSAVSLYHPHKN